MRIQHNIMAMNAYRNYTNNTKALSKNLEKLSSGYKINRAGDDAAGLAISEKMRAQITGLKTAQKNAKDGISLVQTAEGALTEVHSMLNRMVELADQSANGTYDDAVDRANLQKEFDALRTEIDRIADSANFNGIKLLDGSLGGTGSAGGASSVAGKLTLAEGLKGTTAAKYTAATQSTSTITFNNSTGTAGDEGDTFELKFATSDGKIYTATLKTNGADELVDAEGNVWGSVTTATPTGAELSEAFAAMLNGSSDFADLKAQFTIDGTTTGGDLVLTSKDKGADAPTVSMSALTVTPATGSDTDSTADAVVVADGADAYDRLDVGDYLTAVGANGWDKTGAVAAEDAIIDINGQKFAVAADAASAQALVEKFGTDLNIVMYDTNATDTATALSNMINIKTGLASDTNTDEINLKASATTPPAGATGGLTLQIGDTSEKFNQLTVSVADMHAKALGIANISIADQANAQSAVETLKDAINSVSSTRGGLGALQNRLEHTINNLSVMQENIQDAEATIRDVDVAEEMMAYTKNTILVQSAQAMLAQANQVPQGVLQLLQ